MLSTYERGVVQVPEDLLPHLADALDVAMPELRQALGFFVSAGDLAAGDSMLRLPRGVKLSDLDPGAQRALESIVDTFLAQVLREDRG